jgi:hypothetical protein
MILISKTECKFLNCIAIACHENNIPYQFIDVEDIFMYYDLYSPKIIFISDKDKHNKAVQLINSTEIINVITENHNLVSETTNIKPDTKSSMVAMFLDGITKIPKNIEELIYPKTISRIQLFNCSIQHPQNVGLLNEIDKLSIIQKYIGLIDLTGEYREECANYGTFYSDGTDMTTDLINRWFTEQNCDAQKSNKITYKDYLLGLINE